MCLAIPTQIITVSADQQGATVSIDGIQKEISLALVEEIAVGDYVLLHVGYALSKVDTVEAEKTLALFAEMKGLETMEPLK
ncbi:MAG: HypC/HybG/HupF family hydrogenase formation chaperone [Gammaproteobacteria bacterium]|nr:HypC/HybG/HupF family hydrogenase formation chaperone [Gammaproteobacteria bacterium]MBT3488849.1 HypC/HybG/HupF family hydrogenase formation chaperone [Gammaproteobacteria bacterium]MBT3718816.1 HypC/HybG/HupF family hydrogenase formation chaperone [Gammaproteobacteria bacterium]MBT3845870.1 HypC/HybG/HupF family hydrogenase formation chaperone [Gammaproteobacteria bacterium]MBT3894243.1 HypC/HybG/HupF family hydrogenase formation chaperone [Gammaproteobacteria bacterium]